MGRNNKRYSMMEKQINELSSVLSEAQSLRRRHVPLILANSLSSHSDQRRLCGHTLRANLFKKSRGSFF